MKHCTHLWKSFANKLRLVLHVFKKISWKYFHAQTKHGRRFREHRPFLRGPELLRVACCCKAEKLGAGARRIRMSRASFHHAMRRAHLHLHTPSLLSPTRAWSWHGSALLQLLPRPLAMSASRQLFRVTISEDEHSIWLPLCKCSVQNLSSLATSSRSTQSFNGPVWFLYHN